MKLELQKTSFVDEFRKLHSIENHKACERTEGFNYLHDMTTGRLSQGESFSFTDLDFSRFTYDDLCDYMEYYEKYLPPKIDLANKLFSVLKTAGAVFSPDKRYY